MTIKTQAYLQGYLHEKTAAARPRRGRTRGPTPPVRGAGYKQNMQNWEAMQYAASQGVPYAQQYIKNNKRPEKIMTTPPTMAERQMAQTGPPRPGMASGTGAAVPDFDQYNWEDFIKKNPSPGRQYGFPDLLSQDPSGKLRHEMKNLRDYQQYLPKGYAAHRAKQWFNPSSFFWGLSNTVEGAGWDAYRGLVGPGMKGLSERPSLVRDLKRTGKHIGEAPVKNITQMLLNLATGPSGAWNIASLLTPAKFIPKPAGALRKATLPGRVAGQTPRLLKSTQYVSKIDKASKTPGTSPTPVDIRDTLPQYAPGPELATGNRKQERPRHPQRRAVY